MFLKERKEKVIDNRKLILALRAKQTVLSDRRAEWEQKKGKEQCK